MLNKYSISPDSRVPVKFVEGETEQFVMKRFRQCHDLLHLLLDAPTNFEGESYVKAYEFHQTGFPVPLIGFTAAPAYRLKSKAFHRHVSRSLKLKSLPSNPLYLSIYFEERWSQPITELRDELGLTDSYLFNKS